MRHPVGLLLLLVSLALASAGCDVARPSSPSPPCAGVGTVRFDGQDPVPACDVTMGVSPLAGHMLLSIQVGLPAGRRYGPVDGPAHLTIQACQAVGAYHCLDQQAFASLNPDDFKGGLFVGTGMGPMGSCQITNGPNRMSLACDLEAGRDVLRVTGDLPPAPDPRSDPSFAWFEAVYSFSGDYRADAVVEFVGPSPLWFVIPLSDGGVLNVAPSGNTEGKVAWLTLPGTGKLPNPWLPDRQTPSLGACAVTIDDGARIGTLDCPGDPGSSSGSAVLTLTWRPAR